MQESKWKANGKAPLMNFGSAGQCRAGHVTANDESVEPTNRIAGHVPNAHSVVACGAAGSHDQRAAVMRQMAAKGMVIIKGLVWERRELKGSKAKRDKNMEAENERLVPKMIWPTMDNSE